MKILLIATLLSSFAFAHNHQEENFADMKTKMSANIDQKIIQMQAHKTCVQNAKDKEALKDCRKTQKEAMKKFHEQNEGKRKDWKKNKKTK